MTHQLKIFNSLTGEKELFTPLHDNNVGMYVALQCIVMYTWAMYVPLCLLTLSIVHSSS